MIRSLSTTCGSRTPSQLTQPSFSSNLTWTKPWSRQPVRLKLYAIRLISAKTMSVAKKKTKLYKARSWGKSSRKCAASESSSKNARNSNRKSLQKSLREGQISMDSWNLRTLNNSNFNKPFNRYNETTWRMQLAFKISLINTTFSSKSGTKITKAFFHPSLTCINSKTKLSPRPQIRPTESSLMQSYPQHSQP